MRASDIYAEVKMFQASLSSKGVSSCSPLSLGDTANLRNEFRSKFGFVLPHVYLRLCEISDGVFGQNSELFGLREYQGDECERESIFSANALFRSDMCLPRHLIVFGTDNAVDPWIYDTKQNVFRLTDSSGELVAGEYQRFEDMFHAMFNLDILHQWR
jgi:hypothetical protein